MTSDLSTEHAAQAPEHRGPQPLNIAIDGLDLNTIVGADYHDGAITLGDAIVKAAVHQLTKDQDYRGVSTDLARRVAAIRDETIREQITPVITEAINAEIQQTNQWGEPTGKGRTTLRALIVERANEFFTRKLGDYRDQRTAASQLVTDAVDRALKQELTSAIADEKAKVVAAVRAKAAELIATAVKEGVGR